MTIITVSRAATPDEISAEVDRHRRYAEAHLLDDDEPEEPGVQPVPRPTWDPHREPCGECHLQDGETCDICGAIVPLDPDRLRDDRDERRRLAKEYPDIEA